MIVRSLERCDVGVAGRACGSEIRATPGETLAAELSDQNVGGETRPTAVSVWKGVYGDEPVMETHRDLIWRIRFVLNPISRVVNRLAKRDLDQMRSDTEIAFCCPVFSRPAPDALEHAPMQALEETFAGHDVTAAECSLISRCDILLFEFVQFAAQGDMGRDEVFPFRRRQWGRMIVGGM